jgi:ABC-type sugar transport system substrate-binding protein
MEQFTNGLQQALHGTGVQVLVGNSEDDATKEVSDLNSFLERGVGALITIPVSGNAPLVPILQKAISGGAYTEGELAGPAQSVVIAFEYKAGYVQGKQLAGWIDSHLGGKANVLYFNPAEVSPLLVPREQGNLDRLRTGGPGIKVVQNIPIIPSVTTGQQDMLTALQAHPDINVVFGDDESVLGAVRAYQSLGKIADLKYASGFDGSPDADAVIKANNTPYKINYGFNYGVLGYVTGQMVARWFEGRSVPLLMNLNAVPLTSSTLGTYDKAAADPQAVKNLTPYLSLLGTTDYATRMYYTNYSPCSGTDASQCPR